MTFFSRMMPQTVFLCVLILMGGSSCVELNVAVTNKKTDARKPGISKMPGGIEIEVHTAADVLLTPDVLDSILVSSKTAATSISEGIGDTECSLNLKLKPGGIPKFDYPQEIWGPMDLNYLNDAYAGVKVVKLIKWCEGGEDDLWDYDGCQKDDGIVVVRVDPSREGILWLHEIGHFFGLEHRNEPFAVMNNEIQAINGNLNSNECASYQ